MAPIALLSIGASIKVSQNCYLPVEISFAMAKTLDHLAKNRTPDPIMVLIRFNAQFRDPGAENIVAENSREPNEVAVVIESKEAEDAWWK